MSKLLLTIASVFLPVSYIKHDYPYTLYLIPPNLSTTQSFLSEVVSAKDSESRVMLYKMYQLSRLLCTYPALQELNLDETTYANQKSYFSMHSLKYASFMAWISNRTGKFGLVLSMCKRHQCFTSIAYYINNATPV